MSAESDSRDKKHRKTSARSFRVVIPDEEFQLATFEQDDMPGVAALNGGLIDFEPKIVFQWHLSIMLHLTDLVGKGMPSQAERALVDPWEEELALALRGPSERKPNSLFLARITWNATRELIYRMHDPEAADAHLRQLVAKRDHPRPFDYRIDPDPDWKLAEWHLSVARGAKKTAPKQ